MNRLLDWFDNRTGYRDFMHEALYERIPGGARWRYVWGSTLSFTFFIQVVTGLFLWMAYSPSARSAWESVYFIQYQMQWGWLLRGIHHFTAQAMVILLALHLVQVVIDGAYKAPREVNFWLGLVLMQIVLALSLTGYLLPWDQKGYWATNVATNLISLVPGIGEQLQRVVVGGSTYGHATLTRFFALHAGVLPAILVGLLVLHIKVFRRHGICAVGADERPATTFWPDQVLKDAVACLAILAVILGFAVKGFYFAPPSGEALETHLGAELGAPADPAIPYSAARPEWYFLFLFQFLKYFPHENEFYGAVAIPGLVMVMLFVMPFVGRWKLGHRFNLSLLVALGLGVGVLTTLALREDSKNLAYQEAVKIADENRLRVVQLAMSPTGIPDSGATALLRDDPRTAGAILFRRHCLACHTHKSDTSSGEILVSRQIDSENPSAPNLAGFASREWITGMLDPEQIVSPQHFKYTAHGVKDKNGKYKEGGMVQFVMDNLSNLSEPDKKALADVAAALSFEAKLASQRKIDEQAMQDGSIERGRKALVETFACTDCHKFGDQGDLGTAPDLTGYGSRDWLIAFISNPADERFYAENNERMPTYARDPANPKKNILKPREIEILADRIRGDWYVPNPTEAVK